MQKGILACWLCAGLTISARAGDIIGTVSIESPVSARKRGAVVKDKDYDPSGKPEPPPYENEVEDVVIYLEGEGVSATPLLKMSDKNTVYQRGKEFRPHVLPVPKGSKVYFRNRDPYPHHVYSVSNPGSFEIPKHGSTIRDRDFDGLGEVEIFCGIHTKMNAYVLVLNTNLYTSPNQDGKYRLGNVAAGQYAMMVWHPRLPKPEKRFITVPSTGVLKLDLKL